MASAVSFKSRALHGFSSSHSCDPKQRSRDLAVSTLHPTLRDSVSFFTSPPYNPIPADRSARATSGGISATACPTSHHSFPRSRANQMVVDVAIKNLGDRALSSVDKAKFIDHAADQTEHQTPVHVAAKIAEVTKAGNWNLRPRKSSVKKSAPREVSRVSPKVVNCKPTRSLVRPESTRLEITSDASKRKMLGFSISLTREEIDADIIAITGFEPSKKPKKRAKAVQRQLDETFPGLWLDSITADSYRVGRKCA